MSSTNRSDARNNHTSDYYITPVNRIIEFLNEFNKYEDVLLKDDTQILDPCGGGDSNHPMSYPEALLELGVSPKQIDTIDIRDDSLAKLKGDYIEMPIQKNKYSVIITNPPFNLARDIIEKALLDVDEGGFVIMLLRLNYFGGKLRKDMWEKQLPKYAFVHNKRISFTDDGKTDSIEYMHCVWQKGYYPEFTQLKVI